MPTFSRPIILITSAASRSRLCRTLLDCAKVLDALKDPLVIELGPFREVLPNSWYGDAYPETLPELSFRDWCEEREVTVFEYLAWSTPTPYLNARYPQRKVRLTGFLASDQRKQADAIRTLIKAESLKVPSRVRSAGFAASRVEMTCIKQKGKVGFNVHLAQHQTHLSLKEYSELAANWCVGLSYQVKDVTYRYTPQQQWPSWYDPLANDYRLKVTIR